MLIALALPVISQADYHYVSHSGSNIYPYTSWETAADNIQAAIGAASSYDTIYISSGIFTERIGGGDTCLTFIGAGMDSTFIESTIWWMVMNNTLIRDMAFQTIEPPLGILTSQQGASMAVCHCRFFGYGYALFFYQSPNATVEDCEFDNVRQVLEGNDTGSLIFRNNYVKVEGGAQIMYLHGSNFIFENNIFKKMGNTGFSDFNHGAFCDTVIFRNNYVDKFNAGPSFSQPRRAYIVNNTVRRTASDGYAFFVHTMIDTLSAFFINNAITESGIAIYVGSYPFFHASTAYNGLWGNINNNLINPYCLDCIDTVGNIEAFPMYANPDSFDVHLQAFSPFIDAGDPSILDVDGTRSDIGCYGGPGGCSYTYLDLAPQIPDSISGSVDSNSIISLVWRRNYEADFNRYQVFRDTFPGFSPSVFNMVAEPETAFYQDSLMSPSYYYRLTSVDNQGNVSDYSEEVAVRPVGIRGFDLGDNLPKYSVITNAYPNPFNQDITIVYSASNLGPQPPEIKLLVYDIQGRVVRTLVDERKPAGTYRIVWDGKDNEGNPVSSGNYIAKLSQWGCAAGDYPVKITLVK